MPTPVISTGVPNGGRDVVRFTSTLPGWPTTQSRENRRPPNRTVAVPPAQGHRAHRSHATTASGRLATLHPYDPPQRRQSAGRRPDSCVPNWSVDRKSVMIESRRHERIRRTRRRMARSTTPRREWDRRRSREIEESPNRGGPPRASHRQRVRPNVPVSLDGHRDERIRPDPLRGLTGGCEVTDLALHSDRLVGTSHEGILKSGGGLFHVKPSATDDTRQGFIRSTWRRHARRRYFGESG